MSKICPLFSGSTGNSTYIETEHSAILVDAGVPMKKISQALANIGADLNKIKAIAVTHQHIDHISSLRPILNRLEVPLIASEKTIEALANSDKIPQHTKLIFADKEAVEIGDITLKRFATSHDCEGSSGFNFLLPHSKKFTLCTDLGIVNDEVRSALADSYLVLLESNHDIEMLKKGPYPPELKIRILSEKGHISNIECAAQLARLLKQGTNRFILGHLSQKNNTPLLARAATESALMDIGAVCDRDYQLTVARPSGNGVTII